MALSSRPCAPQARCTVACRYLVRNVLMYYDALMRRNAPWARRIYMSCDTHLRTTKAAHINHVPRQSINGGTAARQSREPKRSCCTAGNEQRVGLDGCASPHPKWTDPVSPACPREWASKPNELSRPRLLSKHCVSTRMHCLIGEKEKRPACSVLVGDNVGG